MNIIKNTENLLASIRDGISRLVYGKQFISQEILNLATTSTVVSLNVPVGATEARIVCDCANTQALTTGYRYTLDGVTPTLGTYATSTTKGTFVPNLVVLIIQGNDNLKNFRALNADGIVRGLSVTYYK